MAFVQSFYYMVTQWLERSIKSNAGGALPYTFEQPQVPKRGSLLN